MPRRTCVQPVLGEKGEERGGQSESQVTLELAPTVCRLEDWRQEGDMVRLAGKTSRGVEARL